MKDINFLSDSLKQDKRATIKSKVSDFSQVTPKTILGIIVVLIILGAGFFIPNFIVSSKENELGRITQSLNEPKYKLIKILREDIKKRTSQISSKEEILKFVEKVAFPPSQLLIAAQGLVPKGCTITSFAVKDMTASIGYSAENSYIASEFLSNIHRSSIFEIGKDDPGMKIDNKTLGVNNIIKVNLVRKG